MKKLSTLILVLFVSFAAMGQMTQLGQSEVFPEPRKGDAKILMLKNGNTALIMNMNGSVRLRLYDPAYKLIGVKVYSAKAAKMKQVKIIRSFEIGDNIVLFFKGYVMKNMFNSTPTLMRLTINAKDGALKEKKKVANVAAVKLGQGYAMAFGGVPEPDFYVRKDKNSDHYAVLVDNSFEKDRSKVLQVTHYDANNKELGKSYVSTPDGDFKYIRFNEMMVTGDEVNVLLYAFNTRSKGGGEKHKLFLATVKGNTPSYKNIPIDVDADYLNSIGKYNKSTNQIVFLSLLRLSTKEAKARGFKKSRSTTYYSTTILLVDQASKNTRVIDGLDISTLDKKSVEYYGSKRETFAGVPENLFINKDGGFTVVLEGYRVEEYRRTTGSRTSSTFKYFLEDLGILTFDKTGRQLDTKFIPKSQMISSMMGKKMDVYPLYHNDYENSAFPIVQGNQYKSFSYLNGKDGNYIMYNESQKNISKLKAGKEARTTQGVSGLDGYYYDLGGMGVMPKAKKMFTGTTDKKHKLGLFCVSDYNIEKDIYVTLKLETFGKSKKMRVVWVQPD